jgi:outer membrane protein OmpA-like peptidoglycan-associated protein
MFSKTSVVYFQPESVILDDRAQAALLPLLALLLEQSEREVSVEGHCALYGSEAGRQTLSVQRAVSVAELLKGRGWNPVA